MQSIRQIEQTQALLWLQENAGSMAMRLPFFADLVKYLNCSVLAARSPPPLFSVTTSQIKLGFGCKLQVTLQPTMEKWGGGGSLSAPIA